jgi:hypothetical protein
MKAIKTYKELSRLINEGEKDFLYISDKSGTQVLLRLKETSIIKGDEDILGVRFELWNMHNKSHWHSSFNITDKFMKHNPYIFLLDEKELEKINKVILAMSCEGSWEDI